LGLSLAQDDAQARRLGGGKAFGRQSSNVTQPPRDTGAMSKQPPAQGQQPTQGQQAGQQASPASAAQPPARSRWGGILGGLVAGLGIAALLSHFGLGGAFAGMLGSVIMIALLVLAGLFVLRMLRGTPRAAPSAPVMEPATQPAISALRSGEALPGSVAATLQGAGASGIASPAASSATWAIPAEFDTEAFLRSAKVHFLRLQAAWDKRDLDDIREFTTPEVFAEIRMQMSEDHGGGRVDIEPLEAQLLGIETTERDYLASVRFSGMEREAGKPAQPFAEVWNLSKPLRGNQGWLLAGIQQLV
jgi:predicted lipid-binding transport protein (Tim44 family)